MRGTASRAGLALAAAAVAGMAGLGVSGIGASWGANRRAGYGWTNMHQRRVARKKRNQARNRAAHRGRT